MSRIRMYTTRWCGYCVRAKMLLEEKGLPYEEINLDDDPAFRAHLHELTGGWTVPQILIDDGRSAGTRSSGGSTATGRSTSCSRRRALLPGPGPAGGFRLALAGRAVPRPPAAG